MFDFFQIIDFNSSGKFKNFSTSFESLNFYSGIRKFSHSLMLRNSYITYLERDNNTNSNYHSSNGIHIFIYGSVFSNNEYFKITNKKPVKLNASPVKLNASNVYEFYKKYNLELVKYLKGSFVISIYEENKNTAYFITDRLNVLPLYYFYSDGILIISSSVKLILKTGLVPDNIDEFALTEQLLFDYILGDKTYYKSIKRLNNGTVYKFSIEGIEQNKYWSVENLYREKLLPREDSLDLLAEQLFNNVQLYTSDTKKLLVSLTGGFDGRTNVAMLRKNPEDFHCYSYGMPGSKQIEIPKLIAEKTGIDYQPVYCDEEFENNYVAAGEKAVDFSNGNAPFSQAVMPYAYQRLSAYSDTILSGLFGSEILRPLHNLGIIFNDYSEKIFRSENYKDTIAKLIRGLNTYKYLNPAITSNSIDTVIEYFGKNYFEKFKDYDPVTRFFFFVIEEGIRKYFSQEIQIERVYVTNRFPYLDDDFVDLVYQTTYAGMYNGFLGKSKYKRRKGQLLYAHIIKKYKPELGDILLDRGYKPKDLLLPSPFNYFKIAPGVYKARKYREKAGNDTFNTPLWSKSFIAKHINVNTDKNIFNDGMKKFNAFNDSYKLLKYSHLLSIKYFLAHG